MLDPNMVLTVPANGPAPNTAGPLAGSVLTADVLG